MNRLEREQMEPADTLPVSPPTNGQVLADPVLTAALDATEEVGEWVTSDEATEMLRKLLGKEVGPYWCSIPTDTPRNKARGYNAMAAPSMRLKAAIGKTLLIKDVCITINRFETEEGETLTTPRITLIDVDGHRYSSVGKVPVRCVRDLVLHMDAPPWSPPLPLKIEVFASTKQNRDSFGPVIDDAAYDAACTAAETPVPPAEGGEK